MHGIYTHIPETNHVPKQYNVAAILSLLFMVPITLASVLALMYFYIYYYYYYYYYLAVSAHMPLHPSTLLEPPVTPTTQPTSFTLQYFPDYA
jgi:hypothetical protein